MENPRKYSLQTPGRVRATLVDRLRKLRLAKGWRQVTLAERSGVSLASLRRFEASGRVSLGNLLKLAFALGRLDDFDALLREPEASTMAELEARAEKAERQRGRI
jgi:transcriptional regulator with XRE-family HTH domain